MFHPCQKRGFFILYSSLFCKYYDYGKKMINLMPNYLVEIKLYNRNAIKYTGVFFITINYMLCDNIFIYKYLLYFQNYYVYI